MQDNRSVNKVTPKYDLSWYVKWIASVFVLAAVVCRSAQLDPIYDILLSLIGTVGWLTVGLLWHDRALILLNGVLVTLLALGAVNYFAGTV